MIGNLLGSLSEPPLGPAWQDQLRTEQRALMDFLAQTQGLKRQSEAAARDRKPGSRFAPPTELTIPGPNGQPWHWLVDHIREATPR